MDTNIKENEVEKTVENANKINETSSVSETNADPIVLSGDIYVVITMEHRYNKEVEAIPEGAYTSWDDAVHNARTAFDNSENGEHQHTGYYLCYDLTEQLDPLIGGTAFSMETCTDIYSEVDIKLLTLNKAVKRAVCFEPAELEVLKKAKSKSSE